ncbi:hypothetical protein DOM21_08655 [Bacteriovorax stolpii]|uniref:Uncharacterized protein n=1 Tax=Bacteriovorax stolpii TaxID=960 RepID=A0A2K9NSK5_BACTC|nr:hypothetical protein [Bacteriovorax stolpii]AUN98501.1 hypothetical protein C0V70_10360 [Bacteriovorax stolpii]QDK41519.1 hypothetical protein DOM21_08655 [Bacteriovorax stolpii]TDP50874.1 hypothetical protein C8D79_3611 [Bacteriovorax stolpii]BDT28623.1 hypothetical protein BHI3_20890 [Bacteriovorax sp. HI3]
MKSLLVVVASMLFSTHLSAETMNKTELTDSFTDQVKSVSEEGHDLVVKFHRHAAIYKITKEHPQFKEIKAKLEKAQKVDQKIKVVAIIPSMTIKEIKE